MTGSAPVSREATLGVAFAVSAFGLWGMLPLYFKAVATVPAPEVLGHRIVWSVVVTAGLLTLLGQWPAVQRALADRALRRRLVASALLISANWLIFIWAVAHDRVLEASLGYFITPLLNVALGRVFLGEILGRVRGVAVVLALFGVAWLLWDTGVVPWVALGLASLFAGYGLIRKIAPVGALPGLFIETLLLAPFAGCYLLWLGWQGTGTLGTQGLGMDGVLVAAGVVTSAPLLFFAGAARRLRLATLGLLNYLTPTLQMLLAVAVFGEAFTAAHAVAFGCIWTALALYSGRSLWPSAPTETVGERQ